MASHYYFGFLILLACYLLEALPINNNEFDRGTGVSGRGDGRGQDVYRYNGMKFGKDLPLTGDQSFLLFLKPVAYALSPNGLAIANPVSNVVIARNRTGSVVHMPIATAIAGPGGIAHAQSDLNLYEFDNTGLIDSNEVQMVSVQYLPFYGGARGQYLEIKKDTSGAITSERIVSEDKISSDSVLKNNNEETLLSKVLAANLQSLRSISNNILKLHNLGRKTGRLGNAEKNRFRNQLAALGEAASNTIKLLEEIGDNVDTLFKKNATALRKYGGLDEEEEEDVGEEGIGIDADGSPADSDYADIDNFDSRTIAEAKPVGLAVIGEHGIAASRPVANAVAISGVAIASPIANALAGVDPSNLGLDLHINRS